ncbi:UDP-N-acetylglucosamine 1-carboxyvinyltransferase [Clostridium argentinense CDC 2741]|uniref:UDP-N-acetylglucosamine 1-carboxyvinyltransferase n=1 Tax=Clostridium argentinense CDC 2741 TaxID=1418104 RepID=A0A0C1QWX8_9CLOT|nr:UDP-N-acetylglucosamine 1-carboxyvinyltransferase [Clostridium argentinense]ARC86787.1 UDP-N-acetylglucosamine 1-carboxyvinyltransferase [Clostridium argentinense]KIE45482.1 UDP-N-acetylglucosamine 1-carboxyvinyltransferase [Clostridium argentinense CDC 2741]NFF38533.1 UDP-N-acetylglucosamine 1-carboxyvinyltransferase [Clostridium argentinense]NFP49274.1 UDP-N-acetylglucosamine 1-carboxyvinyltransferase [Clostridium argentinense]NFP71677.1 UDP-N-acetylglucosamine 1-carboxyvinyltransferase [
MDKFILKGGKTLRGEVNVSSAKNSVLPILAATILSGGQCTLKNAPMLEDVYVLCDVLRSLYADVDIDSKSNIVTINTSRLNDSNVDHDLVRKMRASFLIMGAMIGRFGRFKISLPGGCNIGSRPIDLHLKGLSALGADITMGHGYVEATARKLIGKKIYLDFPSVGATENIMMAAVLAEGETIIENAAEEPEIVDLATFLRKMGADIQGEGTDTIIIRGVDALDGVSHTPIFDRIEAGTFMIAAAITRSKIKINNIDEEYLKPVIAKLKEMGVTIECANDSLIVDGNNILKPIDIKTMPYPGFPTDMQSQMMSLLCTVKGTSLITETIFENRFMQVGELIRMGANIKIDGRCAVVEGVDLLTGAEIKATDLRAGAALVLAGLCARGETTVSDIFHIDRGYVSIEKKLRELGADIERIRV